MVRRFGFFPIMFATFAITVAFTLSFHDRGRKPSPYKTVSQVSMLPSSAYPAAVGSAGTRA